MALNNAQTSSLNALSQKIAGGYKANATDLANLNFGKSQGYSYNPVPTGATKISGPSGLQGLNESQLFRQGADIYKLPSVIPSESITGNTAPKINTTDTTDMTDVSTLMAGTDITQKGLESQLTELNKQTSAEAPKTLLQSQFANLADEIKGSKTAAIKEAQNTYNLPENIKNLQNVNIQLATKKAEYDNASMAQEGRVGSASSIYGRQALITRQKAVEVAGLSAVAQAYQGNITLATETITKAIDAEYKPQEDYLANLKDQLDYAYEDLDAAEKKKADKLKLIADERTNLIQKEKDEKIAINKIMLDAAKGGADSETIRKIQGVKSEAEAIEIAAKGGFLKDLSKVPNIEVVGQDEMGNNIYGYFDTKTGKIIYLSQGANGNSNIIGSQDATADDIANAIKQVESGGNYDSKGGSGENGAYQFMPSTWASWSKEYAAEVLGKSIGNMKMTPENQDAVAKWKIQQWLNQGLNAEQIAAKWNSGSETGWENKIGTNSKGVAYNVPAYVSKVTGALGNIVSSRAKSQEPGTDNITQIKQQLLASKGLTKQQRGDLSRLIDSQGIEGLKSWAYYNRLTAGQQEVFGQYENAQSAWSSALQQIDEATTGAGPYKNLAEKAKPFLAIKRDKEYVDLMGIIEMGQAQLRKGFFGTALTSTEAGSANKFLITDNDDMNTIKWKLEQGKNFLAFANDAQVALSLGLQKPKLEDYLNSSSSVSGGNADNSLNDYLNTIPRIK